MTTPTSERHECLQEHEERHECPQEPEQRHECLHDPEQRHECLHEHEEHRGCLQEHDEHHGCLQEHEEHHGCLQEHEERRGCLQEHEKRRGCLEEPDERPQHGVQDESPSLLFSETVDTATRDPDPEHVDCAASTSHLSVPVERCDASKQCEDVEDDAECDADWRSEYLQHLQCQASNTLAHLISSTERDVGESDWRKTGDSCMTSWDDVTGRRHATIHGRPSSSGTSVARTGTSAETRVRAHSSAAPCDAARQMNAISAEFGRFLAEKVAQLKASQQLGQLSDRQLEARFMKDIGATLRDIADQLDQIDRSQTDSSRTLNSPLVHSQPTNDDGAAPWRRVFRHVVGALRYTVAHVVALLYGGNFDTHLS